MHSGIKTGNLFLVALSLAALSFSGVLFFSLSSLFLNDGGKEIRWMLIVSLIIPAYTVMLFYFTQHRVIRYVLLPCCAILLTLFLRHYITAKYPQTLIPDDLFTLCTVLFISAYSIFFVLSAGGAFLFLLNCFREEGKFITRQEFLCKLRSHAADKPENMKSTQTLKSLFQLFFFIILFSLLSHIKDSSSSMFLTIFLVLFFFSSLAVFLFTRQLCLLAEWRIAERSIPSDITRNWNTVIVIILLATVIISLTIPNSFNLYDSSFLRDFLTGILNLFTIDPYHQAAPAPVEIINPEKDISGSRSSLPGIIRVIFFTIIIIHALIGLIGGIIRKFFKRSEYGALAQFCIRQYEWWILFFSGVKEFFRTVVRVFIFSITLFIKKNTNKDDEVKNRNISEIYSIFKNYKNMPNENKSEIRLIVDEFIKLSDEASRRGYPYQLWMGPSEYLESLIELVPECKSNLLTAAEIFNESRYSPRILPKSAIADFKKHTRAIIKAFP